MDDTAAYASKRATWHWCTLTQLNQSHSLYAVLRFRDALWAKHMVKTTQLCFVLALPTVETTRRFTLRHFSHPSTPHNSTLAPLRAVGFVHDFDHWRIQDVEDLSFAMNHPLPLDKTAAIQAMSFGRAGGAATWHTRRVTRYMTRKQRLVSFPTMTPTLGCIYVTRVSQKQSQVDSTYANDYMHTGTSTT